MNLLLICITVVLLLFGFVILFGAPYLPTKKNQIATALDLLDLKKGQTLIEIGSGDGRVLKAAAERGIKVTGYELNPLLVLISIVTTYKYRANITIVWGNYWRRNWPKTDGIYCFLLDKYMPRLDKYITENIKHPVVLASYAFTIPDKPPKKSKNGVFLYEYK